MRYHPLFEGFWTERKLKGCPGLERLLAIYLFSNPRVRPSGIYLMTDAHAALDVDLPVRTTTRYLEDLHKRQFIVRDQDWIFLVGYFRRQPKQDRLLRGVQSDIADCDSVPILEAFGQRYPHYSKWSADRLLTVSNPSYSSDNKGVGNWYLVTGIRKRNTMSGTHENRAPDDVSLSLKNLKAHAREILAFLNEKAGRSYRETPSTLALIEARLKSGATVANCRGVIARKVREWGPDPKMAKYLRPETLFNATKFESYLGERPPNPPGDHPSPTEIPPHAPPV